MRPITILVACGTSVATSTILMKKLEVAFQQQGLPLKTIITSAPNIAGYSRQYSPDMIVATCEVIGDFPIPVFGGIPFITGIGEEALMGKILDAGRSIWAGRPRD